MKTLIIIYILILTVACNSTDSATSSRLNISSEGAAYSATPQDTIEKIIRSWPTGQKKVTYTFYTDDTTNLSDVLYQAFYPNGNLFKIGQIKSGLEDGPWNYFYQSGRPKNKGYYTNGRMNGVFESFYESGEIEQKGSYTNGQLISIELYNPDGTVKSYIENLSRYVVTSPKRWTAEEIDEIKADFLMSLEPNYSNVGAFCKCALDSVIKHCNYKDFKSLTENQRGIVLSYLTNKQRDCFNLLDKKNNR